jgi:hypothetical protein
MRGYHSVVITNVPACVFISVRASVCLCSACVKQYAYARVFMFVCEQLGACSKSVYTEAYYGHSHRLLVYIIV